ncbi:hypothetical protein CXB51_017487 [Gossypium anomalum]|uniref:Uncharacterized protein n=1 Tax=Gossypium anomalum TaxID=47600 RepID=A0A8J6CYM2_9ROSI|nr:hypothetical protein CXB51_017487 [Gossypium anomalum]
MVCDFLNRDSGLRIISRPVVRFLDLTVCRAMGCFFHCFGVRTDSSRPHLVVSCSKSTERTVSRNRLLSLFVDEEKGVSPSNDLESPQINKGFKDEYRSWLPNTFVDKLQLDKKSYQPPTPNKLFEVLGRSDSLDNTLAGCPPCVLLKVVRRRLNKYVRFECESDASSKFENIGQNPEKLEVLGYQSASKYSPNSTSNYFSLKMGILANGKTRIWFEYVHLILNPVENASPLNDDSPKQLENGTPKLRVKQASLGKDSEDEGSLSSWLKPK